MKKLYRFNRPSYRGYDVVGVFVEDDAEVASCIGKVAMFGEICGKHSDVNIKLTDEQFVVLSDDPNVIAIIEKYIGEVGHNPISVIRESECDEDEDESGD